ncbi:MAG: universal stress protein, partial [Syntrophales bacterium LBB04]|nr:universal stress protein [Syntrophales bacterium LBB04]
DGSELAECVLPHVEAFLKNGLVQVASFVYVLEPLPTTLYGPTYSFDATRAVTNYPNPGHKMTSAPDADYWDKIVEERKSSAKAYLDNIASRFSQYGTRISSEVLEGSVADTLATYAEESKSDLILIATHGRSGIGRWLMGSVADRVLRSSLVPVFMVNAKGCACST